MDILAWCLKYIIFIFNLMCWICGVFLITAGALKINKFKNLEYFENYLQTKSILIDVILIGLLICIISLFGCCGALQESKACLRIYAVFMFVLFVMQVVLVVWTFIKTQTVSEAIDKVLQDTWKNKNPASMNALQLYLDCCGIRGYADYAGKSAVPPTCCGSTTGDCLPKDYQQREGCLSALHDYWDSSSAIIRYGGILVALVEILCFMCACYLLSNIED